MRRIGHHRARVGSSDEPLVALLDGLARSLRSGASFPTAFAEAVADLGADATPAMRVVTVGLRHGDPADEVLHRWAATDTADATPGSVRFVAAGLHLQVRCGGVSADAVDRLAALVRLRLDAAAAAVVESTQARASARVLGVAPVLFAVLVAAGDGDVRAFLLATWAGRCCLGTAVLLDAAAVVVMRRIVAGVSA